MKELNMKYLLRKAGEGILPREIVWRKDKRGYYVPTRLWYRKELYESTRALLEESDRGIIDPENALQFLQNHKTGWQNNEMPIWILTNIELWFRTFMDGESIENVGCDG
jgi:asparagine synthase (glutamine-hydrolysing)